VKTLTYIAPTRRINTGRVHGPRRRTAAASTSENWSGAVVFAGASPFTAITGTLTVPAVDAVAPGSWFYCAPWVGLDGDGSPDVCQAGVEIDIYIPGRNGPRGRGGGIQAQCYAWWEWYPAPETEITNLAVAPGDMISVSLAVESPTTAKVTLANVTTGLAVVDTMTAPPGSTVAGNCAEWIVEAPTVGGTQSAVADFGQVYIEGSATARDATVTLAGLASEIDMVSATGALLSAAVVSAPDLVRCRYAGAVP